MKTSSYLLRDKGSHTASRLLLTIMGLFFNPLILAEEIPSFDYGPYSVGTSNARITEAFSHLSGDEMDGYLIGANVNGEVQFIDEILEDQSNPLLFTVSIPDVPKIYGNAAGLHLPIFIHVTYPTQNDNARKHYDFPYPRTDDTRFAHMQSKDEKPIFAETNKRYPLVFDSHGFNSHGFWGASGAAKLSSHGYMVAVVNFGDGRLKPDRRNHLHENIRPFVAQSALDFLLNHPDYRDHIDSTRIAASGHSLGGYTSLTLAGGQYNGVTDVINRSRVSAVIGSAPWTGGVWQGEAYYPFGENHKGLSKVSVPVLGLYGTRDQAVTPNFLLPALDQLSGPRYVVELVDQPHIYAPGSWQDQSNWVLLFLAAYLKHDKEALAQLATASSMEGGNVDRQKFDLQRLNIEATINRNHSTNI